jgi:two-component system CheB/CheR fusion protein
VQNLPPDAGLAYLIVAPHALDRQRVARLARATALPVVEVDAPTPVQPDHIYVAAPGQLLQTVGNLLQPAPIASDGERSAPLDIFFRTLSAERGAAATAVLLAGQGEDGVAGLGLVKAGGGWTLAQDPDDAEQPALPRRALAAGVADITAPAVELAELIVKQVGVLDGGEPRSAANNPETDSILLAETLELLRSQVGYDFSPYKESMLLRRITRRMQIAGCSNLARYLDLLRTTPQQPRLL